VKSKSIYAVYLDDLSNELNNINPLTTTGAN